MSENEEFIREFLEECEESLDQLDQDLVALEQNPRDKQRLESIFRTIHTIKGTSGFFDFAKLGALAHDGESLLGRLRDGELVLNEEIASALLQLIDGIRDMLGSIQESGGEGQGNYQEISANLIRLALSPGTEPATADKEGQAEDSPGDSADLEASLAEEPIGEPAAEASAPEEAIPGETAPEQVASAPPPSHSSAAFPDTPPDAETAPPTTAPAAVSQPDQKDPADARAPAASEGSIRVDVRLLDDLMDLAGELVLARNQLNRFGALTEDPALLNAIQRLGLITTELQEGVMQTRMLSIATIWAKFPRLIRDLAVACGKEITLEQEGGDTELDRSLLEAIKDPLTHLIRNAVDHGIEPPEARESKGKPRQGHVVLRAFHEGGQVNIEIIDDGGGIDVDRVKQRALERSVIDTHQARTMSDHELVQMIFRPGFSTAEKVTDVSGRGVGMDVVKTNIEKIGGTVSLQNRPGKGTTVRVTIPLTLAIIPALIVTVGNSRFAIPQVNLVELLSYGEQDDIEWVHDAPVYRLRGSLLPLVYLNQVLEIERATALEAAAKIVVVQIEGLRFGLIVDQVINTEEIVVKPLSQALKSISVFAGATIMGDGAVALILDVFGLAGQAGITSERTEPAQTDDDTESSPDATASFLLCESSDGRRVAIPLADVERLEEFPADRVERTASMEVVQYDGGVMPLAHLFETLGWAKDEAHEVKNLKVVVCQHTGRKAGLVVSRIVDIVDSDALQPGPRGSGPVIGSAVIEGRITEVVDPAAVCHAAGVAMLTK